MSEGAQIIRHADDSNRDSWEIEFAELGDLIRLGGKVWEVKEVGFEHGRKVLTLDPLEQ